MRVVLLAVLLVGAVVLSAAAASTAPHVIARIKVAPYHGPCVAAAGGRWVWVTQYGAPKVLRIDPRTNRVVGTSKTGDGACGISFGGGAMWIEDTSSRTVSRVSVRTGKRIAAVQIGDTPYDVTFAYGSVWATVNGDGQLVQVDPGRNRVSKRVPLQSAVGVVGGFGSIWATNPDGVIRVDPTTGAVTARIPLPKAAWTATSADAVWISTTDGKLVRIDPSTAQVSATIQAAPTSVALGDPDVVDGRVWVPVVQQNRVVIVDPASNAVATSIKVGKGPFTVTAIRGQAWIPSWHGSDIWRLSG